MEIAGHSWQLLTTTKRPLADNNSIFSQQSPAMDSNLPAIFQEKFFMEIAGYSWQLLTTTKRPLADNNLSIICLISVDKTHHRNLNGF